MVRIQAESVTVKIPATSANLGPGFDSMGLAMNLYDQITARAIVGSTRVEIVGEGADTLPRNEDHLVVKALRRGLDTLGASQVGVELVCKNQIPQARGLGSSAGAIVGGLMLAQGLTGGNLSPLTKQNILEIAADMEGHPDNVAPALFGGVVVSRQGENLVAVPLKTEYKLEITVFIPSYTLATEYARELLPTEISFAEAVANSANTALLVLALQKEPALLLSATEDYLHQAYRRPAMKPSVDLMRWLRKRMLPAVISGAGPTVLVLGETPAVIKAQARSNGWEVKSLSLDTDGAVLL